MPSALKTLGPGWRCDACDYPLEGLPDRAEHTQCPECGHTARPVGAPPVPTTGEVVFTALLSLVSLVGAGYALWFAWIVWQVGFSLQETLSRGLPAIALAAALMFLSIVLWAAPSGRWRAARWLACLAPAALVVLSVAVPLPPSGLAALVLIPFALLSITWLISPELGRWLRRPAKDRVRE